MRKKTIRKKDPHASAGAATLTLKRKQETPFFSHTSPRSTPFFSLGQRTDTTMFSTTDSVQRKPKARRWKPPKPRPEYAPGFTQCDFIDKKIGVGAQRALYYLYRSKYYEERSAALQMLGAIRSNRLQCIYPEYYQKVAEVAWQNYGVGYWDLMQIYPGWDAIAVESGHFGYEKQHPNIPHTALMIYKAPMEGQPKALADALLSAWKSSWVGDKQHHPMPVPSYRPCPNRIP